MIRAGQFAPLRWRWRFLGPRFGILINVSWVGDLDYLRRSTSMIRKGDALVSTDRGAGNTLKGLASIDVIRAPLSDHMIPIPFSILQT